MNLDTIVRIRQWNPSTQEVFVTDAKLGDIVRNPAFFNLEDLGWHLINAIREDLQLPVLSPLTRPVNLDCPACTGTGNIHKKCILR
jgi:hypothetical protein